MPSRHVAFSLAALAALGITLGFKALVNDFRGVPDFARFDATLATTLKQQGFTVATDVRPFDQTMLVARRDGCLIAARGEVRGDYGVGFRRQTQKLGPLAYSIPIAVGFVPISRSLRSKCRTISIALPRGSVCIERPRCRSRSAHRGLRSRSHRFRTGHNGDERLSSLQRACATPCASRKA